MSLRKRPTSLIAAGLSVLVINGCSTTKLTQSITQLLPGHAKWSVEERAWADLLRNSSSQQVSSDRVVVEAWGPTGTDMDDVEFRLLARAAAEMQALSYDHFIIVHIADRNRPISGGLNTISIFGADDYEIGSYEGLVRTRYERDYAASPRAWVNPGIKAVIRGVSSDELDDYEETFQSAEVYDLLNRSGMAG